MRRSCVYVVLAKDRWMVKLAGMNIAQPYGRKAQAVRAAIEAARDLVDQSGSPACVRVQQPGGAWEERRFGDDLPPAANDQAASARPASSASK